MRNEHVKKHTTFSRATEPLRYGLARLLIPSILRNLSQNSNAFMEYVNRVPRPMIVSLKSKRDAVSRRLVGAEIGVSLGDNALSILKELPMERLFLIDPYSSYFEDAIYRDHTTEKETASKKLSFYPQVRFIYKPSKEAVSEVPDGLDFVYVDGNHDYRSVKEDLSLYHGKVKSGGLLGGHDYYSLYRDVVRAVDEFAVANGYRRYVDFFTVLPDFWVVRP